MHRRHTGCCGVLGLVLTAAPALAETPGRMPEWVASGETLVRVLVAELQEAVADRNAVRVRETRHALDDALAADPPRMVAILSRTVLLVDARYQTATGRAAAARRRIADATLSQLVLVLTARAEYWPAVAEIADDVSASSRLRRELLAAFSVWATADAADTAGVHGVYARAAMSADARVRMVGLEALVGADIWRRHATPGLDPRLGEQLLETYANAAGVSFEQREPYIRLLVVLDAAGPEHIAAYRAALESNEIPAGQRLIYVGTLREWGILSDTEARRIEQRIRQDAPTFGAAEADERPLSAAEVGDGVGDGDGEPEDN